MKENVVPGNNVTHGVVVPGSSGAPGILQDEEVHSQLHQVLLYRFSGHAAVHGVDQLGSLPVRNTMQHRYNAYGGLQPHFMQSYSSQI